MKKLVSTLNLGKKEWLKYRKGGIGGSDAGAICGLNPYREIGDIVRVTLPCGNWSDLFVVVNKGKRLK